MYNANMPAPRSTPTSYRHAHELRQNMTREEISLWGCLKGRQFHGIKFRKQHAIGIFIVDFCAIKEKLIIEVDGGQHLELLDYDRERTAYLEKQGFRVIRFWNNDVLNNINAVINELEQQVKIVEKPPPPTSPKYEKKVFRGEK